MALEGRLRAGLYAEGDAGSDVGTFKLAGGGVEIHPGRASFLHHEPFEEGPARVEFGNGRIAAIKSLADGGSSPNYWLESEVITSLSGFSRSEQHLVHYQEVPKVLLNAVLAAEDHRFFSHNGVNWVRMLRAARIDLQADKRLQGGSTLTMQLARNLFLRPAAPSAASLRRSALRSSSRRG